MVLTGEHGALWELTEPSPTQWEGERVTVRKGFLKENSELSPEEGAELA